MLFVTRPTTGGLSALPFLLPRSPSRSIFAHRFIVCLPRSFALTRAVAGSWSSLSRARSEGPARRSSLSHALSISRRGPPTAISSTRPRYLSRTSRRPIIRCGSRSRRLAYLAGRSFGDRPIGRSSDRKRETKEHFYFLCRTQ